MSYYLNNRFRNGLSVSQSVADEILNTYASGFPIGPLGNATYKLGHAVLMNICRDKMEYSFEDGTVVIPHLINLCDYDDRLKENLHEKWVVTYCDVRFYKTRGRKRHGNSKAVERWTAPDLQDLRKYRYWRSPDVKAFPVLIATYPKLMNEYIERHGWEGIEVSADAYISLEKDELGNSYFTELVENNDDDYYEGYE